MVQIVRDTVGAGTSGMTRHAMGKTSGIGTLATIRDGSEMRCMASLDRAVVPAVVAVTRSGPCGTHETLADALTLANSGHAVARFRSRVARDCLAGHFWSG